MDIPSKVYVPSQSTESSTAIALRIFGLASIAVGFFIFAFGFGDPLPGYAPPLWQHLAFFGAGTLVMWGGYRVFRKNGGRRILGAD